MPSSINAQNMAIERHQGVRRVPGAVYVFGLFMWQGLVGLVFANEGFGRSFFKASPWW